MSFFKSTNSTIDADTQFYAIFVHERLGTNGRCGPKESITLLRCDKVYSVFIINCDIDIDSILILMMMLLIMMT